MEPAGGRESGSLDRVLAGGRVRWDELRDRARDELDLCVLRVERWSLRGGAPRERLVEFEERARAHPALVIGGGIAAGCLITFLVIYAQFAAMIDRRLAEGAFSSTLGLYSAQREVAAGDAMTRDELIDRLRRAGYSRSPDNPTGYFKVERDAVEIRPGPASLAQSEPVRVEFAPGRIARIRSLRDRALRREYLLDPQLIANVSADREKRRPVRFSDIPQSLVNAVVAVEDKRFFKHVGFDPFRMVKAAYIDLRDGRKQQGASTLSMQLARNLWLDRDKAWKRKLSELVIAMHLERKLSKQEIFEDYANSVYLGRRATFSIQGFGEAARAYFDKDISQLDAAESALLAGMIQRPSYYNPFRYPERARERRDLVLGLMRQNGSLTDAEYERAVEKPVRVAGPKTEDASAPYFTALVQDELQEKLPEQSQGTGYVRTTLDPDLQQAAEDAVRMGMENVDRQLQYRKTGGVRPQVALIALDPRTGQIRALVGGRDYAASQLNHAIAQRQPGSVFKPFVYTAALTSGVEGGKVFTPATILNDEETTFYFDDQVYEPDNFGGRFMGPVTMRTALSHSLNVATVDLASQVGYDHVVAMARRAGLNDRIQPTPAVALGAYEATPLEIAGAYTMFANDGIRVTPTTLAEVRAPDGTVLYRSTPDAHAVLDPRVNYLMVDMLEEVLRSGTGAGVRSRGFTLPAAGKTGTSRDGWFAGFTSELLCVVWVGYDDNRDLKLEGARSALPIWTEFMERASKLPAYRHVKPFREPRGIVTVANCAGSGCASERFIAGTEPARVSQGQSADETDAEE